MAVIARVTARVNQDIYHGCSTGGLTGTLFDSDFTRLSRRTHGNRVTSAKPFSNDYGLIIEINLEQGPENPSTKSTRMTRRENSHSTGSKPKNCGRRRHGQGPAFTPKHQRFSNRKIHHEARLEAHKAKKHKGNLHKIRGQVQGFRKAGEPIPKRMISRLNRS